RAGRRNLVLRLERAHAEGLVARELLEDRRRGRDRVGAEEEVEAALDRGSDEAVRDGRVAGDLPVDARSELRRLDLVRDDEVLARLAVVVAGHERPRVRLDDLRARRELRRDE